MIDSRPHEVVKAATALAEQIRAARDELEATRRLPPTLVHSLAQARLFQLALPRSIGGLETDPLTSFQAIEALSRVDGSVGWCAMIASAVSHMIAWLRADVARAMFGQPPDVRIAGSIRPEGQARLVKGGYRISGQWDFASGIHHANWLACSCKIVDEHGVRQTPAGAAEFRTFLVPVADATILDTWSVVGMCGTGSHDFMVEDVFVPAERTFSIFEPPQETSPLYHPRLFWVAVWTLNAGNALGIARGAMDAFVELATHRGSTSSTTLLRDRALVQARVAEAEAIIGAARAYVLEAVGAAWEATYEGRADPGREIAQARLAITHAIREAMRAVDLLFQAAGTNAIYRKHPLERYFRDIHVAAQHGAALPGHYEAAGQALMGLRPRDLGW